MYPLVNWSYSDLRQRLEILENAHLYPELVVVTSQLIEQIIKRYLLREINLQRRTWSIRDNLAVPVRSSAVRDALFKVLNEPKHWKKAWHELIAKEHSLGPLPLAFDSVVGLGLWRILETKHPYLIARSAWLPEQTRVRYGLRHCRHKLVHGTVSPPSDELKILGCFGKHVVVGLLQPETGWSALLGWNAQSKMPLPPCAIAKRTL